MRYFPYSKSSQRESELEETRRKEILEFLVDEIESQEIKSIWIQDPYIYDEEFTKYFLEQCEKIDDLESIRLKSLWVNLLHEISDGDIDDNQKELYIISVHEEDIRKILPLKQYGKLELNIVLEKKKTAKGERKIHDRFILIQNIDETVRGIHIGLSLSHIMKKDVMFTKIGEEVAEKLHEKCREQFQ